MAYLNITEVESAIAGLASAYPGKCELITLPETSVEGRVCHAVRIGTQPAHVEDTFCIIGGVHAREWGSCEILVNLATDLLEAHTAGTGLTYGGKSYTAAEVKGLVEGFNWVIFPLVNPDGRRYSQTTEPMWRKNRNPRDSGGDPEKVGVDLNRNHDFLWDFATTMHPSSSPASDDPSSDIYHGNAAYSEPETRNVRWLLDQFPRARWFMDVHSYSELILYNWGNDENQSTDPTMNFLNSAHDGQRGLTGDAYKEFIPANDLTDSIAPAEAMRDAIAAVRGTTYFPEPGIGLYATTGTNKDFAYCRHYADPSKNKVHGYTLEWGTGFQPAWAEMEEIIKDVSAGLIGFMLQAGCSGWTTTLLTESIVFNDVPEGQLAMRAVLFNVNTCNTATFSLDSLTLDSGPGILGQLPSPTAALPAAPGAPSAREARLWIAYQATAAGSVAAGTAVVRLSETGQTWTIPITANVIRKPTVASMLVLDQSGSMDGPSGISTRPKRIDVLRFAAPSFVNLLRENDGIGVVAFDHDAHDRMDVRMVGSAMGNADPARSDALGFIATHSTNMAGFTAIGDGVERAHDKLAGVSGYDNKAIVVFTDGHETEHKYISEVSGLINERVFAIGLGTAAQLQPAALTALTNGTGGFLLLTGAMNDDNSFLLNKYFMQVLAGVTNQDVVLDPEGYLQPGAKHRIGYLLNEADISVDTILTSLLPPDVFRWYLETPDGVRVDTTTPGVTYTMGTGICFYRMTLPLSVGLRGAHAGQWYAVLELDHGRLKEYLDKLRKDKKKYDDIVTHGLRYSLNVQSFSGVRMAASVSQNSNEPGADLYLKANLTEYGQPIDGARASVKAEVEEPDGARHVVILQPEATASGTFSCAHRASQDGVYRIRVMAKGDTLRGRPFTREQLLSAAIWKGGDQRPPGAGDDPKDSCSPCGWFTALWRKLFCHRRRSKPH